MGHHRVGTYHFMERHRQRRTAFWWATTNKGTSRPKISEVWKRITRLQSEYGITPYSVATFEDGGGLHAHIIFIGTREIARRLQTSKLGAAVHIYLVTDHIRLVRGYLAKSRTPQAGYGRTPMLGGRIKGSYRVQGGGDRVRLSRELERDAIEAGYVEPWQHTNARRSTERKPYRLRPLTRRAPRLTGQIPLSPEFERPVARLRQFGGGLVPAVAVELEFLHRKLRLSQREFAAKIGVSQGQYTNAIRGHDPMSAFAINRAREMGSSTQNSD